LVAEKFEKMDQNEVTKQLETLFAKTTMHPRIFCICCAMT